MAKPGESGLLDGFFDLPPELATAISTVLGFALLGDLTAVKQNALGYFFSLIGEILQTNANNRLLHIAEQQTEQMENLQCQIEELRQRLQEKK